MSKLRRPSSLYDHKYRELIEELIKIRKQQGVTQQELAEGTGVSQPEISKVERFERRIDVLEFVRWVDVLAAGNASKALEIWKELYESYCQS